SPSSTTSCSVTCRPEKAWPNPACRLASAISRPGVPPGRPEAVLDPVLIQHLTDPVELTAAGELAVAAVGPGCFAPTHLLTDGPGPPRPGRTSGPPSPSGGG